MNKICQGAFAAFGAALSFFCGLPMIARILLGAMTLDYVTGIATGIMGRSAKTETGGLSSFAAFAGLMKKVAILVVVLFAVLLDAAVASGAGVQFSAVSGATCLWFIASEGVSLFENAAKLGVPIPPFLMRALEIMRKNSAGEDDLTAGE